MLVLAIKTDSDLTELSLFRDTDQIAVLNTESKRQLADKIHLLIKELLTKAKLQLPDLEGIIVCCGPGSFTGLRIGISVANALAMSLGIPICSSTLDQWPSAALKGIIEGKNQKQVMPFYGAEPNITKPKK